MTERDYFVHPSAYVDEPCEIGAGRASGISAT